MVSEFVIGIDVGTTNCKCVLVDKNCMIIKKLVHEIPLSIPNEGWAEQDPEIWWKVIKNLLKRIISDIDAKSIKAIGLSGQMHGLVLLDAQGCVLRPAILWNDQRSAAQCDEIYEIVGGQDNLLKYTNNAMIPGYVGNKILWVKENEPYIFSQVSRVLLPKDYIRFRLCHVIASDFSDASGTGLFNVKERRWSEELLELLKIPAHWFPPVYSSFEITGTVLPEIALEIGLPLNTPVIAGGGDAIMQMIGSATIDNDIILTVLGTGGNVTANMDKFPENPKGRLQSFCHVIPDKWVLMGVSLSAGSSLKWFRDTLGQEEMALSKESKLNAYEILAQKASSSQPGSHGLLFLPYLLGERCPYTDTKVRGSWLGISLHTSKSDMIRSIMEGVIFSLRDILSLIESRGIHPQYVHASGGGAVNSLWRQIQADIFNREIYVMSHSEDASTLGAAMVAGVPLGFWSSIQEAVSLIPAEVIEKPNENNALYYKQLFKFYQKQYSMLKSFYDEMYLFTQGIEKRSL